MYRVFFKLRTFNLYINHQLQRGVNMFSGYEIALALGVFSGNWLLLPVVTRRKQNFRESFAVGALAGLIVLLICALMPGQLGEM